MNQLAIVSGKGGTGKTTVAASLAALWGADKVLADCDVDASNLPLVLRAQWKRQEPFYAGGIAAIKQSLCSRCGLCFDACRFRAIEQNDGTYEINALACEGCDVCKLVCPTNAITMYKVETGRLYESETVYGPLVHAELEAGRENSGKLVTFVRQTAKHVAEQVGAETILIDGSPGIGCPVIATLTGVDLALVVTEPTLTGLQGMERILSVARHFQIPRLVCINKVDLNRDLVRRIESRCAEYEAEVVGVLPFDRAVVEANSRLEPIVKTGPAKIIQALETLAERVQQRLKNNKEDSKKAACS